MIGYLHAADRDRSNRRIRISVIGRLIGRRDSNAIIGQPTRMSGQ